MFRLIQYPVTLEQLMSEKEEVVEVSEDILNVIQSGQVKTSSTSNKLSLLM